MPTEPASKPPSFSPRSRWKIGFDLGLRTLLVVAVAVMVNLIGAQFFHRFYLSAQTRVRLSPRTLGVLRSITNQVAVTLYYDRGDDFYPDVVSLLKEYHNANQGITISTVDPVRNPGEAEQVKAKYGLDTAKDKNLIIFDAGNGRVQIRNGEALIQHAATGVTPDRKIEFTPVAFNGEEMFTAALLALQRSASFKAYFLQGDGEPSFTSSDNEGYLKFAAVLKQNNVTVTNLELSEVQNVPADCDLLVYVAPLSETGPLDNAELEKIQQYLAQGGRLLALFNYVSIAHPTGLERILAQWGIRVAADGVEDLDNSTMTDVVTVSKFGRHPVVDALAANNLSLQMVLPRPVVAVNPQNAPPDAPQATELAFSGPDSKLRVNNTLPPRSYPLIAAVEQKEQTVGMSNPRGATRILVAGDSLFLGNYPIEYGANRDFLGYAVNWLLDRPQTLDGIGPQPVTEFRLMVTRLQQREIRWLLLVALPGAVLLLGGAVWMVRRK